MDIYVGNLPWKMTEEDIEALFDTHGEIKKVTLIKDRETGKSKGFAFVTMADADANQAIAALDGKEVLGRDLKVNKAKPKVENK